MPSVTYNGQSFAIDNRRFWISAASIQYTRIAASMWSQRISAAKQAGFNTIETACPWCVHEPRRDRFSLKGQQDVREFISLCGKAGMKVILRPGPYVGSGFDGGGLPAWLTHSPGVQLREGNEPFLERVNVYFRKLLGELEDLQVTQGGPILLVQSEHAWLCSNKDQADKYLREVTRVIRESGFKVPITNANDFWQESPGTIDTWRGREDLLGHLRQLRTVQPDAPRLLSAFDAAEMPRWGGTTDQAATPSGLMYNLAQCLASGSQYVVSPFHGGSNLGFLGGRFVGAPDQFATTSAAAAAPLGEAGGRGARYGAIKRITSFANSFGSLFAELETDYHPVTFDVPAPGSGRSKRKASGVSVVQLRGSQGRVAFVLRDDPERDDNLEVNLLLENGVRMPVQLGDQPAAWFVFDADINGSGRIDYANLCPYAIVGKSMVVFQGPAGAKAYISINGTPLQSKVPGGEKPVVIDHKGIQVIICSQQQIDSTYCDASRVYVGVSGLDDAGLPVASDGNAWVIEQQDGLRKLSKEERTQAGPARRRTIALREWEASSAAIYTRGDSPRYATLDGPQTLAACGAQVGYGWYAIRFRSNSGRKRLCHLPLAGDRLHLALDGEPLGVVGVGPGAQRPPIDVKLSKGEHVLTALVDNLGRFSEGHDLAERKGLFGHVYEVKPVRNVKPKTVQGDAIDPFVFRSYIPYRSKGQLSDTAQVCWSFTHAKKSPIIVDIQDVPASGSLLLNDEPLMYYPGASAGGGMQIVLTRDDNEMFKRGKNELRFAPDARQHGAIDSIGKGLTFYEAVDTLSEGGSWTFAKWEPPIATAYEAISKTAAKALRGMPCWWRVRFNGPRSAAVPMWFDTRGLSKGQVFINGQNVGRYFTTTVTGKAVGPQTRLYLPEQWVVPNAANELLVFDEHGCDPSRTRLVLDSAGDLDG